MQRAIFLVAAVLAASILTTGAARADGAYAGTPTVPGISLLTLTEESTPEGMVAALGAIDCDVTTIAVLTGGAWSVYIPGAPAAVNAAFPSPLASGTPFFVRCELGGLAQLPPVAAPLELSSSAIRDGGPIPPQYTCDGANVSPPLTIANIPVGTVTLALIVDDPDAPGGTWDHWIRYNIEPVASVAAGASSTTTLGDIGTAGLNSFGSLFYGGPCPPPGPVHHYQFELYALDTTLTLGAQPTKAELEAAMAGRILGQTVLVGTYSR